MGVKNGLVREIFLNGKTGLPYRPYWFDFYMLSPGERKIGVKKTLVSKQRSLLESGVEFQLEFLYVNISIIKWSPITF